MGTKQTFSVLSWNIQGKFNITGYTQFRKVKPHLTHTSADIIALQEAVNVADLIVKKGLLKNYHIAIPPRNLSRFAKTPRYNHNVIFSKFPFIHVSEITVPQIGQRRPLEHITHADIQLPTHVLRLYNCHFPIFKTEPVIRERILALITEHCQSHNGPVIICGDLNTTVPPPGITQDIVCLWHQIRRHTQYLPDERTTFLNLANTLGFTESLPVRTPTWSPVKSKKLELFKLKLDWFLTKGLLMQSHTMHDFVSDHRGLEILFKLK